MRTLHIPNLPILTIMPTIQYNLQSDDGTILVPHLLNDHDLLVLVAFVAMLGHSGSS